MDRERSNPVVGSAVGSHWKALTKGSRRGLLGDLRNQTTPLVVPSVFRNLSHASKGGAVSVESAGLDAAVWETLFDSCEETGSSVEEGAVFLSSGLCGL